MTPSPTRRGAAIFPVTVLLLLAAGLGVWSARTGSLAQWAPATCLPDHCFCEAIGSGAVAQPANAWSSLAFVLAGLWIAQPSAGRKYKARNRMVREPAYRRLYGCALVAIGLGSYFYHATLTFAGQVCDMSGMYLLITFALFYGVARITRIRTGVALAGIRRVQSGPARLSNGLPRPPAVCICGVSAERVELSKYGYRRASRDKRLRAGGCGAAAGAMAAGFPGMGAGYYKSNL